MKVHAFETAALPTPLDLRDIKLGSVTAPVDYPPVYMEQFKFELPIYYQSKQPACGAHAAAWFKACLDTYEKAGRKYTPRFSWIDIKTFDGHDLAVGTDIRAIFKSLANRGALDFDLLGNDVEQTLEAYADKSALTKAMYDNAQPKIIGSYAFHTAPGFEDLKRYIYLNKAVIARMNIGNSWWTDATGKPSWAEKDVLPLRAPTADIGGHFVVLHSYDENYIYFANSFSEKWGRAGHGYFSSGHTSFVTDIGTAVDIPDETYALLKKKIELLTILLNIWRKIRGK